MTVDGSDTGSWEITSRDPDARPLVSVLMLTYNHVDYLEEAILGVVQQQFDFDVELIISDDCSSDGTTKLALDYQVKFPDLIRVIGSDSNVGMYANHVRLLRATRGEYIAFCEGDDYWTCPDKLALQVDLLASQPGVGLVHTAFDRIAYVRRRWRSAPGRTLGTKVDGDLFEVLLSHNVIQTCTVMTRSSLIQDFLGSACGSRQYAVADWPLFLYASAKAEIAYLDRPTAAYRRAPGSQTNSGPRAELVRTRSYLQMLDDFTLMFPVDPGTEKSARHARLLHLADAALRAEDFEAAREAWQIADQLKPSAPRQNLRRRLAGSGPLLRLYRWSLEAKNALSDLARYRQAAVSPEP